MTALRPEALLTHVNGFNIINHNIWHDSVLSSHNSNLKLQSPFLKIKKLLSLPDALSEFCQKTES